MNKQSERGSAKTALVTGASSGIGAATAERLAMGVVVRVGARVKQSKAKEQP
ncbi:MAG: hypothetical protein AABP62_23680 [Planctomycetota bacterium]